jgi:ParB-like nuclease domain
MARIAIDLIEASAATQIRVRLDQDKIEEYAQAIRDGAAFPAITVFAEQGSERFILADGFHRLAAAKKAEREEIGAEVKLGGLHEALHYALGCNAEHGLPRNSSDKRHAVLMALKDPHYEQYSLRDIGELCRVSHSLVQSIKAEQNETERPVAGEPAVSTGTSKRKDVRTSKPEPTQEHHDRNDLRGALAIIKSFPYNGEGLIDRLELNPDDEESLRYCAIWLDEALA